MALRSGQVFSTTHDGFMRVIAHRRDGIIKWRDPEKPLVMGSDSNILSDSKPMRTPHISSLVRKMARQAGTVGVPVNPHSFRRGFIKEMSQLRTSILANTACSSAVAFMSAHNGFTRFLGTTDMYARNARPATLTHRADLEFFNTFSKTRVLDVDFDERRQQLRPKDVDSKVKVLRKELIDSGKAVPLEEPKRTSLCRTQNGPTKGV